MAEDRKVVTKKTPSKKAVTKKTLAKAPEPPRSPASIGSSGTTTKRSPVAKKAAAKKAVTKKAPAAAKKVVAKKAPAPTPASKKVTPSTVPGAAQGPVTREPVSPVSDEERHRMIEEAAYYRAEKRGFEPGHNEEDWAAATEEVDAMLREGRRG
jgi:hypothetical protein